MRNPKSTPSRRTVLSALASGLAASAVGTASGADSQFVLKQGDRCEPVRPLRGEQPVEEFYDYQLPEKYVRDANGASVGSDAPYSSAGPQALQREATSVAFLYRGPDGLSLVVIHGAVDSSTGGSATFRFEGLPTDGGWAVRDDRYRNPDTGEPAPTNYDRWRVDGAEQRISWTWGSGGTDGGAFRGLGGDFEVVVKPSFNQAAALFGEHYEGTVTDWAFLSGSATDPERIPLDLGQSVRIRPGTCGQGRGGGAGGGKGSQADEQASERQRETERREDTGEEQETERRRETEQDGEQATERESEAEQEQEQDRETERERETEEQQETEGEEDEESGRGNGRGGGHDNGNGNGHGEGRGKGHEKGRGKGHEKHGDDDEDDEDEDGEDDEE